MQLSSQLFLLNKYESAQHSLYEYLRKRTIWSGYRKRLFDNVDITALPHYANWNADMASQAERFLQKYNIPASSALWHKAYYSATGLHDLRYVCEPFFYDRIETRLAPRSRIGKYFDKNFYERMQLSSQPKVLARLIAGRLTFSDFSSMSETQLLLEIQNFPEVVIKPSLDSGGGNKIQFVAREKLLTSLSHMKREGLRDVVIQEPISQCAELAVFHSNSTNTLRIMTLRFGRQIQHLSTTLRIGRGGSRVDSGRQGGISVGVHDDGSLKAYGFDQNFLRFEQHPDSKQPFLGHTVPAFSAALALVCHKHESIPDVDLISWDVAINLANEPLIVEMNMNLQGISILQLCNGPLFGERTDAIFQRYMESKKKRFFGLHQPK